MLRPIHVTPACLEQNRSLAKLYLILFKSGSIYPEPPLAIEKRMWRFRRSPLPHPSRHTNKNITINPGKSPFDGQPYQIPIQPPVPATQCSNSQRRNLMGYNVLPQSNQSTINIIILRGQPSIRLRRKVQYQFITQ